MLRRSNADKVPNKSGRLSRRRASILGHTEALERVYGSNEQINLLQLLSGTG